MAAVLGMLPREVESTPGQIEHDQGWNWVTSPVGGWWQPSAELGKPVTKDEVLGQVSDLFGDVTHEVKAPEAGIPMIITTSPAVAAEGLLMVLTREVSE